MNRIGMSRVCSSAFNRLTHLVPVHLWHHNVQQNQIRWRCLDCCQRPRAVESSPDLITVLGQHLGEKPQIVAACHQRSECCPDWPFPWLFILLLLRLHRESRRDQSCWPAQSMPKPDAGFCSWICSAKNYDFVGIGLHRSLAQAGDPIRRPSLQSSTLQAVKLVALGG